MTGPVSGGADIRAYIMVICERIDHAVQSIVALHEFCLSIGAGKHCLLLFAYFARQLRSKGNRASFDMRTVAKMISLSCGFKLCQPPQISGVNSEILRN